MANLNGHEAGNGGHGQGEPVNGAGPPLLGGRCGQRRAATIAADGLDNVWFNILWTSGTTAGHPGFRFDGAVDVAETWTAAGLCGLTADDHSRSACP